MKKNAIFLIGAPGAGKTTLARALAKKIDADFFDLDEEIVSASARTIPEIFSQDGEDYFRALESKALSKICARVSEANKCTIVALGGGALLKEENRALVEKIGDVVCLEAPEEKELKRRLSTMRNPLGDQSQIRAEHYASFKNRVASFFELKESLILVGNNLAHIFAKLKPTIADKNVAEIYQNLLPNLCSTLPPGEKNKTLSSVEKIWTSFAENSFTRDDAVISFGGGVTNDLVGFAAATWMRGMSWWTIPTTLLSMVDASVGGKTAFDLSAGKNLIGAFHFPRLVIIDTAFLTSLSEREIANGKAEMIKHNIIAARKDFEGQSIPSAKEMAESIAVKISLVEEDPKDKNNKRILLNCGHTIGHALEKASDYSLSHGEAVAIGCVTEARIARALNLASDDFVDELEEIFKAANLPTALPFKISSLVQFISRDKKRVSDSIVFALPCGWGSVKSVQISLNQITSLVV